MATTSYKDPAIETAIAGALGAGDPAALATFEGPLMVRGGSRLDDLARLPALRELTLEGFAGEDLAGLSGARALRTLRLHRCAASDIAEIGLLEALQHVEIVGSRASDIEPLLRCGRVEHVDIHGMPLSSHSQRTVLSELFLRPRPNTGRVPLGSAQDIAINSYNEDAVPIGWALVEGPGGTWYAVRLGSAATPQVISAPSGVVQNAFQEEGLDADSSARLLIANGGQEAVIPARFGRDIVTARLPDARARVEASSLSAPDKAWLAAFLGRFPEQIAWWETDAEVDRASKGAEVPGGWRRYRTTIAMVAPNFFWSLRFRSFQANLPGVWREPGPLFYDIRPGATLGTEERYRFNAEGLFPVGIEPNGGPVLVFDANRPEDPTIWVVSRNEVPLRAALSPAFSSYAALLGHADAVRLLGKIVVPCTDAPDAE
ncbi:MAG: hypothetical protein Q8P41_22445 [Pseudomonadota bacterium]|nr:hypothetical protein [Pseudomonadota bacterium]